MQDGLLDAAATFAAAARTAKVEQVVNLSQWLQPDGDQPTPHQTRHWLTEQIFHWAGVGVVHLDATVFYENLVTMVQHTLTTAGVIALPWGPDTTAVPLVGAQDVAEVAAAVLTGPTMPGGTVLRLITGASTNTQIATAFSEIIGRSVPYVEVTDAQWAQAATAAGYNAVAVEHLAHLWRHLRSTPPEYQALYYVSDTFEQLTGRPPRTLTQFLREHAHQFAQATSR